MYVTVHLAKFKPCLKILTVSTVSIGAKPAKVTKYSINYTITFEFCILGYIRVTCPLLYLALGIYHEHSMLLVYLHVCTKTL